MIGTQTHHRDPSPSGPPWLPAEPFAVSRSPFWAANNNALYPCLLNAFTSAPRSISSFAIAGRPSAAAHISGVCPALGSTTSNFAPRSSINWTASTLPEFTALISGVSPIPTRGVRIRFRVQEHLHDGLVSVHSHASGVSPFSSATFALAPAFNNAATISTFSRLDAQASAVDPSGRAAFTSAPRLIERQDGPLISRSVLHLRAENQSYKARP